MQSIPYWRLSSFYWFYFCVIGAFMPYWTLYLQTKGFDAQSIGQIMALFMALKIVVPNFWGFIADHTKQPVGVIKFSSLLALICFGGIFFVEGFWGILLVMGAFGLFWNAPLPQVEAMTFSYLGIKHVHRYTQIRVWGTIGFIVMSAGLGWFFTKQPVTQLPVVMLGLLACVWLVTLSMPQQPVTHKEKVTLESIRKVLRQPAVTAFFITCLLTQASHSAYYTFYSIYLESYGYNRQTIGFLWAVAAVAEVFAFLVMHRLLARYSLRPLLILSFGLAGLRWLLIGYYPLLFIVLFLAQTLHAASFGLFHAVAIQFIVRYFPPQIQGRGQALYNSLGFGAGIALGNLLSGYLWDAIGAQESYLVSAGICGIAMWVSWQWMKPQHQ